MEDFVAKLEQYESTNTIIRIISRINMFITREPGRLLTMTKIYGGEEGGNDGAHFFPLAVNESFMGKVSLGGFVSRVDWKRY